MLNSAGFADKASEQVDIVGGPDAGFADKASEQVGVVCGPNAGFAEKASDQVGVVGWPKAGFADKAHKQVWQLPSSSIPSLNTRFDAGFADKAQLPFTLRTVHFNLPQLPQTGTMRTFSRAACLLGLALFGAAQVTLAQGPGSPLSLAEAIAWGVDNNLAVAGQELNVEVAARNNNYVTAGRAPLVQATLGFNNALNRQNNPASFINGTFYNGNASAGLLVNYTLFNGYRVRFDLRRLGQLEQVSRDQVRLLVEASIFDVGFAYYNAQLEEARARVAREVRQLSLDRLAYQELRRQYGQGQSIDLLQARSAYLNDSVRVEQARLAVDNSLQALYLALDADEDTFSGRGLGDTLLFDPRDWDEEEVVAAVDSGANLRLLRTQQQLTLTQTEIARTAFKPTVQVNGGLNYTETGFQFLGTNPRTGEPGTFQLGDQSGVNAGITAAYTLFDAGQRRRNLQNAQVNERIAEISVRNARQDAAIQARTLLQTYNNQRELLGLQDALIDNARANLALADEQLKAGTINSFDYRNLELNYLNAEQARLQAVYNLLVTDLQLRRVTGRLIAG